MPAYYPNFSSIEHILLIAVVVWSGVAAFGPNRVAQKALRMSSWLALVSCALLVATVFLAEPEQARHALPHLHFTGLAMLAIGAFFFIGALRFRMFALGFVVVMVAATPGAIAIDSYLDWSALLEMQIQEGREDWLHADTKQAFNIAMRAFSLVYGLIGAVVVGVFHAGWLNGRSEPALNDRRDTVEE